VSLEVPRGPMREVPRRQTSGSVSLRGPRGALREVPRRRTSCSVSLRVPRAAIGRRTRPPISPSTPRPRRGAALASSTVTRKLTGGSQTARKDNLNILPVFVSSCSLRANTLRGLRRSTGTLGRRPGPAVGARGPLTRVNSRCYVFALAQGSELEPLLAVAPSHRPSTRRVDPGCTAAARQCSTRTRGTAAVKSARRVIFSPVPTTTRCSTESWVVA